MSLTFFYLLSLIGFSASSLNPVCLSRLPTPRENRTTFPSHRALHLEMAGHRIIGKCQSRWFLFILRVLNRSCWTLGTLSRVSPTWAHPRLPSTQWPSSKSHETLALTLVSINTCLLLKGAVTLSRPHQAVKASFGGKRWYSGCGIFHVCLSLPHQALLKLTDPCKYLHTNFERTDSQTWRYLLPLQKFPPNSISHPCS